MKTKSLLKAAVISAMFMVMGWSANAQLTGVGTFVDPTVEPTDSVTIGSTMPYNVKGDPNMHLLRSLGILDFSQYTKAVSAGGAIFDEAGTAAAAAADSAFTVNWTVLGAQTVSVTEVPQPMAGMPAYSCTANTQVLPVVVLPRPIAVWNGAASATGCSVDNTTVTIPYKLTGTGQYNVKYRIEYTALTGVKSNVVATGTELTALGNRTNGDQTFDFSYTVPASAYGKYEVFIENVNDRISRKSGLLTSDAADFPSTSIVFYAYPTPVTQPIKHLSNN